MQIRDVIPVAAVQSFYRKRFDTEEDRVNDLFLKADGKGVTVKKR